MKPITVMNYTKKADGLLLETSRGQVRIEVVSDRVLHITYTLESSFSPKESLMITDFTPRRANWTLAEGESSLRLKTESMELEINRQTTSFAYYDSQGNLLVREPERGGKALTPVEVHRPVLDQAEVEQGVDGIRARAQVVDSVADRTAYHTKLEFEWGEDEALYGLGSHEEGMMNLRGQHQYLYQQNMKVVVPMLVSTKGYGILWDSYSSMIFRDDAYGSYVWTDVDDELDYYFIYGPELDAVVAGYRFLTGTASLLPRWAYGYVQSKERYKTQDELISVVKEYRKRQIPLDVIVLDWQSWPANLWGQKSLDPERFPDPTAMMQEIHRLNARLMISIWPKLRNNGPDHREMLEQNCLLADRTTYDAFSDKARKLYWKQAYEGLFHHGIDAWWCDCTEPFEADWKGEVKPDPVERLLINTGEAKKYVDPEYINAYSLMHSKGIYEGQRGAAPEKRVVNLTRSAYAGQQRYGTITWSGDISAQWETLRKQIPAGLNFCAAGLPYWTLDIGAFFVGREDQWFIDGNFDAGCDDKGYQELYVRWFQYGAFLPMFRSHGTHTPREVWRFGEKGDLTYDTLVKFDELRYRLLPYIYSLAGLVTHRHYTMLRALAFDFISDRKTWDIDDQFMFGPAFLVNPVTKPMYYGPGSSKLSNVAKTRPVYLPTGYSWYDFWTGHRYSGGISLDAKATLDTMPLYIRSGSLVPLGPVVQHSNESLGAPWELRVYPGSDGEMWLYEDEGDGYGYEDGAFSWIRVSWDDGAKALTFAAREGEFPGMPKQRDFHVVLVGQGHGIGLEQTQADKVVTYRGKEIRLEF